MKGKLDTVRMQKLQELVADGRLSWHINPHADSTGSAVSMSAPHQSVCGMYEHEATCADDKHRESSSEDGSDIEFKM